MIVDNFIGGDWVPPTTGQRLEDLAPATGARLALIPSSGPADIDHAVRAARAAMEGPWGRTSTAERADLCDAIADALEVRADALADLESMDTGKPVSLARRMDIARAIDNFRFFAGAVRHDHTAMHEMADAINYTLRRPLGVVGLITPWNLPLYLLSWKVAPALATGNAVVAKPSELAPLTANALAEVLHEVGAPRGSFNVVHGLGATAGERLVTHPDVAAISFTGGTATGARVGAAAASTFKKMSLELGGKNPTLVFADADLEEAVAGTVRAAFTNQGQICLCGSRVFVEHAIAARFEAAVVERVRALRIGDPADPATELGALISAAHRDKVESYLELARSEGGRVLTGGRRPKLPAPLAGGWYLEPTVLAGLPATCRTATEEIFGPVLTIHPFDDESEAVALANATRYGLAASIWTHDLRRAHRVSAAIRSGMVWVNCWLKRDLRVPFGGVKDSGVGREGGAYSLAFYTEDKNVCIAT